MITKNTTPGVAMVKTARRRLTCKMRQNAFIFVVSGVALPTPRMQKSLKNHRKFTENCSQKIRSPVLQWSKTRAVGRPTKMHKNACTFVVPGFALLELWCHLNIFHTKFNTVSMHSPSIFKLFTDQISLFLPEIHDFEQFS